MAQLIVRKLPEAVKAKLLRRARRHGRSTEDEVRSIIANAVKDEDRHRPPLGTRLAARFAGIGFDVPVGEIRGQPARPARLA